MYGIISEKEKLTNTLSDQYSRNIISLDEYEKMIDLVNKADTERDIMAVEKMVYAYSDMMIPEKKSKGREHVTIFSWRSNTIKPVNGNAGAYVCIFGTNQIKIDDLPKGKTVLNVESIFGLTEIIVPKKIKVINTTVPIFAGIFIPDEADSGGEDRPELHISGTAIFGNITIIRRD